MNRRAFLRNGGGVALSWALAGGIYPGFRPQRLRAAEGESAEENPNWADPKLGAKAKASTFVTDPSWGYGPHNVFGNNLYLGWEAEKQTAGAWLEVDLNEKRPLAEVWILSQPLPRDILGQDPYTLTYSRVKLLQPARKIRVTSSDGATVEAELRQADYFQIIALPKIEGATSLRITVEDVWPKAGAEETGLSKVRIFPRRHDRSFEVDVYSMYDVHDGEPVQAATLHVVNPGDEIRGAQLVVSSDGKVVKRSPTHTIACPPLPR